MSAYPLLTVIGSLMAGAGSILTACITFVFYRELAEIERQRSFRETAEYENLKNEKQLVLEREYFSKRVADFYEEIRARSSDEYPVFQLLKDLGKGDSVQREIAVAALDLYLRETEKVPSERETLRSIILTSLDAVEPKQWPGWQERAH